MQIPEGVLKPPRMNDAWLCEGVGQVGESVEHTPSSGTSAGFLAAVKSGCAGLPGLPVTQEKLDIWIFQRTFWISGGCQHMVLSLKSTVCGPLYYRLEVTLDL